MNALRSWAVLLIACLVPACEQVGVEPNEVIGRYRMNAGKAEDILEIHPNGKYVHLYRSAGKGVIVGRGKWEYEEIAGRPYIALHDFIHRYRSELGASLPQNPGIWPAPVVKSRSGSIRLSVNQDLGRYYLKVSRVEQLSRPQTNEDR